LAREKHAAVIPFVSTVRRGPGRSWSLLLAGSMTVVVCIRFFSENLGLVPGVVQFIDVPLTALVAFVSLLALIGRGFGPDGLRLRAILFAFLTISLVSMLVNTSRTEPLPALLFFFGFASPLIFASATINARLSRGDAELVLRTFFWLGALQLAVGVFYGLPQFFITTNPDFVSGTFGRNPYQFTYFIGVWFLYVLGGVAVKSETKRRGQGVAITLAALAVFGLFYAAQYRAMLIFFTPVMLLTLWVSPARISSRLMQTIVISTVSVITLIVVATAFPNLKLLKVLDLFEDTSPVVQSGKVTVAKNVVDMYLDMPQTAFVGSGPATFGSRGYTTFANDPDPKKDAASPLAIELMGRQYSTDVARKYVGSIPDRPIQGGTTLSNPVSSYTSLAAEVGPIGLLLYLAAYLKALLFSYRRLVVNARAGDRLGTQLAFACFGGLILLLIQALFDNWLETTRVAIPLWILVGVLWALKDVDETMDEQTAALKPVPRGAS
jgi:hypothetical protein